MPIKKIKITELVPDDKNLNRGTERGKELIETSVGRFGAGRSVLIDKNNRIIAGNKTQEAAIAKGIKDVIVVETDGTQLVAVKRNDVDLDTKDGREMALADNATVKVDLEWDTEQMEAISEDFGIDMEAWDVDLDGMDGEEDEDDEETIRRKKREFEERMAAGELSDDDPEYQEFLKKFELKKTTDDCYTPPVVYDALAEWVAKEYNVDKKNFVRPFYPNGDYQSEKYKRSDIVVDNPPFSIMAEILKFYHERGIRFFLFAPHLTIFSSSYTATCLPVGVSVTYENGANVNTSFVTNLEPTSIRVRSCPSLYATIKEANDKNLASMRKELPKYAYDHHIVTSPFFSILSRLGIEFSVPVAESQPISALDSQKKSGKTIFGKGYIVSEQVYAERERAEREIAERERAERERAERWELSDKEKEIVRELTKAGEVRRKKP